MNRYPARLATFLLLCLLALQVRAAIQLDALMPVAPQVRVGKLPNGLTYYVRRNATPEKRVELRLVVKAGSILEDERQRGLAHYLEHMAFNGSTHFKKHELVSYLQSVGVQFGADLNAYTSFDETVYVLPLPTDAPVIEKGLLVLQDWAQGLTLNEADVEAERGIILEELRLGKGAGDRINKKLLPKIFNGSRYADRLPIGTEETIAKATAQDLRTFYRTWYRPDLMAVVAVGDIDPAQMEERIRASFAKLANPPQPVARLYEKIPARAQTEALVVTDPEVSGNAVLIRYPVQEITERGTYREYRDNLIQNLFAAMMSARLQELAQEAAPPFLGASSSVQRLTARYESYNAFATLANGGAGAAIDALVREQNRAWQHGFLPGELERAKKNLMRNVERAHAERDKTPSAVHAAELIRNFLEQESIPGIAHEYATIQEMLPGITLDEVNRYARQTIPQGSGKLVIYTGNDSTAPPKAEELLARVARAERAGAPRYQERAVAASLLDQPPKPGSIVAQSEDTRLGLTHLTLSNGVKVILKPTDFRSDQVIMSAVRFGGQSLFGDADALNARYANAIVTSMGLGKYSLLDMQKIVAGKSASLSVSMSNFTENLGGSCGNDDIETLLQFVYLRMTAVRRDPELFRSWVSRQTEAARNALAQPEAQFQDAILGTVYGAHPRVPLTPRPEDFAKLDLERAIDIYQQRFFSAHGMTFIFVGSFQVEAIKPLLATYLASLPAKPLPTWYRDLNIRPRDGRLEREVRSGTEPKSIVSLTFTGLAQFSVDELMRFQAMIDVLNLRITDVLREQMALIYGGGMSGNLTRYPYESFTIETTLPTGPDKVERVTAVLMEELEKLKRDGPNAADLEKVKQNWLRSHQREMQENGYWLNRLQSALLLGYDPGNILTYPARVQALTEAQVKEAAQRYFDLRNVARVVLKPAS
jgi:zinc protease